MSSSRPSRVPPGANLDQHRFYPVVNPREASDGVVHGSPENPPSDHSAARSTHGAVSFVSDTVVSASEKDEAKLHMIQDLQNRLMDWRERCNLAEHRFEEKEAAWTQAEIELIRSQAKFDELEAENKILAQQATESADLMRHYQKKTTGLEGNTVILLERASEAEAALKSERNKTDKLLREMDRLQQEQSQLQLISEEENRINETTIQIITRKAQHIGERAVKDFKEDVERGCAHFWRWQDWFREESSHCFQKNQEIRKALRRRRLPPNDPALHSVSGRTKIETTAEDLASTASDRSLREQNLGNGAGQKRRPEFDNMKSKRIKNEALSDAMESGEVKDAGEEKQR